MAYLSCQSRPVVGSEQGKSRPVLVISENDINPIVSKTTYHGDNLKLDWKNKVKVSDGYTVHLGAEKEKQSYKSVSISYPKANAQADEKSFCCSYIFPIRNKVTGTIASVLFSFKMA